MLYIQEWFRQKTFVSVTICSWKQTAFKILSMQDQVCASRLLMWKELLWKFSKIHWNCIDVETQFYGTSPDKFQGMKVQNTIYLKVNDSNPIWKQSLMRLQSFQPITDSCTWKFELSYVFATSLKCLFWLKTKFIVLQSEQ